MGYSAAKYRDIVDKMRALCGRPFVESIEDNYAVPWNELGLLVKISDIASNAEFITLKDEMLGFLVQALPLSNPYFNWTVAFKQGNKILEVVNPEYE
jgi:hypothetical protein